MAAPQEPPTRRRRPRVTPPTQAELDELPVEMRQQLHDARRQQPWQHLTSLGVLFTLLFSAGGLYFTAKTWETSQQSQITDRYTKAVEQLGSDKSVEVHVGGLYALARIAQDSPADAGAIEDVVKAFLLEHDYKRRPSKSPEEDEKEPWWVPGADASAAVRVLGKIARLRGGSAPNLFAADFSSADWSGDLSGGCLAHAALFGARFGRVDLGGADLRGVRTLRTNFYGSNLSGADLSGASLTNASFWNADLRGANLKGADLEGALLRGADLTGADLTGAKLTGIRDMTPDQVRRQAKTDHTTTF